MATQNQDIRSRAHRSTTIATLALALAGIVTPAAAANFQYRHLVYGLTAPVSAPPQAQQAAAEIVVALTGAPSLPAGEVNASYRYDLKQLLTVTGESWSASNVSWSLPVGALPAGLSLGTDGVISGIPTTKDLVGSSFQVKASYKVDILPALSLTAARSRGKGRGFPLQDGHARPQPLSRPYSQQA